METDRINRLGAAVRSLAQEQKEDARERHATYHLVASTELHELEAHVNRLMAQGWQPLGGLCAETYQPGKRPDTFPQGIGRFVQVMIRY